MPTALSNPSRRLLPPILLVALLLAAAGTALATDWPQFHRDLANTGATPDPGPADNNIKWRSPAHEDVNGSPAVVDGYAYFTDNAGYVYCVDVDDGSVQWDRNLGWDIDAGPAVAYGKVYIGDGWDGSSLRCLDAATGNDVWTLDIYSDWVAPAIVADGKVFCGNLDQYFVCAHAAKQTSAEPHPQFVWEFDAGGKIESAAAADAEADLVYFCAGTNVYCLPFADPNGDGTIDADAGEVVWSWPCGESRSLDCAPALHDTTVIFGTPAGKVVALDRDDGALVWEKALAGAEFRHSSPAVADIDPGEDQTWRLYIGAMNGLMYCLDPANGDSIWAYDSGGVICGSPSVAGTRVYYPGGYDDAGLYCLDAAKGSLVWLEDWHNYELSTPAIVDSILYVGACGGSRDGECLFAFETDGGSASTRATVSVVFPPNDGFPVSDVIYDTVYPEQNSVRFDMYPDISPPDEGCYNTPGDSVLVDVEITEPGYVLADGPVVHYMVRSPNTLFDQYRYFAPDSSFTAEPCSTASGDPVPGRWCFDLPDSNLLFPGDVLHFYVSCEFEISGGQDSFTITAPADANGFGVVPGDAGWRPGVWDARFEMRALPTLDDSGDVVPPILLWADGGVEDEILIWQRALAELGLAQGVGYDLFVSRDGGRRGNGLGGRATSAQLEGYQTILYSGGRRAFDTICQYTDDNRSDDVGVLLFWLASQGRNLLACGEGLATDLAGSDFLANHLGVEFVADDVAAWEYADLSALVAVPQASGPIMFTDFNYSNGSGNLWCLPWYELLEPGHQHNYDAIKARSAASADNAALVLEYGGTTANNYSAMVVREDISYTNKIVTLPYDLSAPIIELEYEPGIPLAETLAETRAQVNAPSPTVRAKLLKEILTYFGQGDLIEISQTIVDVPGRAPLTVTAHPNPFNPVVVIEYDLPAADRLSIAVYDVMGRRVRTLVDAQRPAGPGSVTWDGRDDAGRPLASGSYFCRSRSCSHTTETRLMLVR